MRSDRDRLIDILEAIENIERYVAREKRRLTEKNYFRSGSSITCRL
jgi:uncharacterized protein with HEPN domain